MERCDVSTGHCATLSLVLPAYNEAAGLQSTTLELQKALDSAGIPFELLLVDNGSQDGTEAAIRRLTARDPRIRMLRLAVNQGYGGGILKGLRETSGDVVGYMASDGQVHPEDVVRVYQRFVSGPCDIAKVRREVRGDGPLRDLQSLGFNWLMRFCFGIRSWDINGSPKLMDRRVLNRLAPVSQDWFLDAEIMIKAHRLGLTISELPIRFRKREEGRSNVSIGSVLEFIRNVARYRFGKELDSWSESQ